MLWSSQVSAWPLFQRLSKLTVMMLVSEIIKIKKFTKDTMILH